MISAKIIEDSISPQGERLTSFILTVPQIIVKELLRHRMFSFSSSSVRAIPFNKILNSVKKDMFIPLAFQSHHTGMQGQDYLSGKEEEKAREQWIFAALSACEEAEKLYNLGVTKQLCSRIIEPYGYATILLTATDFENFFEQRCPMYVINWYPPHYPEAVEPTQGTFRSKKEALFHTGGECRGWTDMQWRDINVGQAEIHMQALAEAMWDAMNESSPRLLQPGEWHLPFGDIIDEQKILSEWDEYTYADNMAIRQTMELIKIRIATARCARISYNNFSEKMDHKEDIKLYKKLFTSGHMSPFEHCARAMTVAEYATFIKGKLSMKELLIEVDKEHAGWCNNFKGFIPYRYIIENKYDSDTKF